MQDLRGLTRPKGFGDNSPCITYLSIPENNLQEEQIFKGSKRRCLRDVYGTQFQDFIVNGSSENYKKQYNG